MKNLVLIGLGTALVLMPAIADTKVKLADLPSKVQAAVKEQTKNATLIGLSKEVENGKTTYEIETRVNGKSRDVIVDVSGKIVEVEDEVVLDAIPAPAKQAIQKNAEGGTIQKVETVTIGSSISYEAVIQKKGKTSEFSVNADGSLHK